MGEGNKKLSKRDPQSDLFLHRDRGMLPEGLLNYLALLGWGLSEDRDVFSLQEMVAAPDIRKVNANPARFDQKKAEAINAEHIRRLPAEEFARRLREFLLAHPAEDGLTFPESLDGERWATVADLLQTRIVVLSDAWDLMRFLVVDESSSPSILAVGVEEPQGRGPRGRGCGCGGAGGARRVDHPEVIEAALSGALVENLGIKPRKAYGPVRVAVTGSHISPPLFESLELLGRDATLARLKAAPIAE